MVVHTYIPSSLLQKVGLREAIEQYAQDHGIPNICCNNCGKLKKPCHDMGVFAMLQYRWVRAYRLRLSISMLLADG